MCLLFALVIVASTHSLAAAVRNDSEPVPVVMWHGMGDCCCNPESLGAIQTLIEKNIPGVYVKSLMIGDNVATDTTHGYTMPVNEQVELACAQIASDPKLANGYNAIGFSQGGQFLRGVVQRCNTPKVKNLVSVGGQHMGVYGLPHCPGDSTLCDYMRSLLALGAYVSYVQDNLAQANYWNDPLKTDEFMADCTFLPDINNLLPTKNATYKANLESLENFVMVMFLQDSMVVPKETEWFSYYPVGSDTSIVPLENSTIYLEDFIGLKTLDDSKRLIRLSVDGDHLQFTDEWFVENLVPYLK